MGARLTRDVEKKIKSSIISEIFKPDAKLAGLTPGYLNDINELICRGIACHCSSANVQILFKILDNT